MQINKVKSAVTLFILFTTATICGSCSKKGTPETTTKPPHGAVVRAVAQNDRTAVTQLLKQGADVNENVGSDEHQITPLLAAISMGHTEMTKFLVLGGASLSPTFEGYQARDFVLHTIPDGNEIVLIIDGADKK